MNAIENNIIAFVAVICVLIGVWFFSLRSKGKEGLTGDDEEEGEEEEEEEEDEEEEDGDGDGDEDKGKG